MVAKRVIEIGVTIVLISCLFLWVGTFFHDYVYNRLNICRNGYLTFFWSINCISSFLLYYFCIKNRLIISIIYILFLSGIMTLEHLISGEIGFAVDFSGISGLKVVSVIYFIISSIIISVGGFLGFIMSSFRKVT